MDIRERHNEAMDKAEYGDIQRNIGNTEVALALYNEAYNIEREVSLSALDNHIGEPGISILLKSAASLAMRCGLYRDAEKLTSLALSGEPPEDVAEELRNMIETINFNRHLNLQGFSLQSDEVQLVIAGRGVGYGYAKSNDALARLDTYHKLTIRTMERKSGKVFRKTGRIPAELGNACQPYISTPMAASIAFRVKFGGLIEQSVLAGFGKLENVIDDINDNIELIGRGDIEAVKKNIKDDAYFNNFISHTKELAPDGRDINLFGITSMTNGKERKVQLTSKREDISLAIKRIHLGEISTEVPIYSLESSSNTIEGILSAADNSGKVTITSSDKKKVAISVPDGLSEIVKTYWEEEVVISYNIKGKKKILLDIDKI